MVAHAAQLAVALLHIVCCVQDDRPGVIVNLRRTNLVKMALSKMQHGLGTRRRPVANETMRVILDFELLLDTIEKYCIQDQEWASFVTYSSFSTGDAFTILYEDFLAQPEIILETLQAMFTKPLGGLPRVRNCCRCCDNGAFFAIRCPCERESALSRHMCR